MSDAADVNEVARNLVDVRAVEQVFVRYFDRVDADDAVGAAALFAEDARVEIMTGKVYDGRDAFGRALDRVLAQYEVTSHHVSNFDVEVSGDQARCTAYVYAYHRLRETGEPWHLFGRIVDVLERRPDGGWVIIDHTLHGVDSTPRWEKVDGDWYRGHPGRRERDV